MTAGEGRFCYYPSFTEGKLRVQITQPKSSRAAFHTPAILIPILHIFNFLFLIEVEFVYNVILEIRNAALPLGKLNPGLLDDKQAHSPLYWQGRHSQPPYLNPYPIVIVQSLSRLQLFAIPWIVALQASLSSTTSQSLLKLMSVESVMPSNHLILCRPVLLLPSIFPSIWVFSNESTLCFRWPKYWSFGFSISPSNEYSGLISFRI